MTALAPVLQKFFTTRLTAQYGASMHTITAYRDTWRLLLRYAAAATGTAPSALELSQLDSDMITRFLAHLATDRGNAVSTRNARLAAIHSLFAYAAYQHPEHGDTIRQVLSIPTRRAQRTEISYLTGPEVSALLDAPDRTTTTGRRDHALFQVAVTTGMRICEITGLRVGDVHLGAGAHVVCHGKGRKDRITPLDRDTIKILRNLTQQAADDAFVFPTREGTRMSHDAVSARLKLHTTTASAHCPSLTAKKVTAHVLRHTAAMRLLAAGIDSTVIALWLGHESIETTQIYLHADMKTKDAALARTKPTGTKAGRYIVTDDALMIFLNNL